MASSLLDRPWQEKVLIERSESRYWFVNHPTHGNLSLTLVRRKIPPLDTKQIDHSITKSYLSDLDINNRFVQEERHIFKPFTRSIS
jgi:hypothetical protein